MVVNLLLNIFLWMYIGRSWAGGWTVEGWGGRCFRFYCPFSVSKAPSAPPWMLAAFLLGLEHSGLAQLKFLVLHIC